MKDYIIVSAKNKIDLIDDVNNKLKEGYKLAGGVCVHSAVDLIGHCYYQSLYKDIGISIK